MSTSASKGFLHTIYDREYLQFVSQVLSSSRFSNNLRDQLQNHAYNDDEGEYHCETGDVLFCRGTGPQENEVSSNSSFTENPNVLSSSAAANINYCDDEVEVVAVVTPNNTSNLFNNDLYANDSEESDDNDDFLTATGWTRSTKRTAQAKKIHCKKSKQKKKHRSRTTFDDFGNAPCLENDIRDIVKSALAMDIRKQPHTNIFVLQDEDLQELRNIYGNEADTILKLEQQQELVFQKACDKINHNLLKYNVPKK